MPIILDTNVVSELMYVSPEPNVIDWFDAQGLPFLLLTTITEAELLFRIELMPEGKNRRGLMELTNSMLNVTFGRRILVFDSEAAGHYAVLAAARRSQGKPIDIPDCQIAAIAKSIGAAVATRNVKDFEDCGVEVINPWNHTA